MQSVCSQFLPIKRVGNVYKCLCPFHDDEKTPSFTVYKESAYCFGCKKHWDAIGFLMQFNHWSYPQAIQWLEQNAGILPKIWTQNKDKEYVRTPLPISIIDYWHDLALERAEVVSYYKEQRMLTMETIKKYKLGFDGERYIIPLWEGKPGESEVCNVKKRKMNDEVWGPKYLALKHRPPILFNKWFLEDAIEAYIFFGEFDALLAHQDGLTSVTGGGQGVWENSWMDYFSQVNKITIVPDAGEEGSAYELASRFFGRSHVIFYPSGVKDYVDFRLAGYTVKDFLEL